MTQNRMQNVRDHLVAMMEELKDPKVTPEALERARAISGLAQTFTNNVKVELDFRREAGLMNELPEVLKAPALPPPGRGQLIEGKAE